MKFKMIEKFNDGSVGKHSYSQAKIKTKVMESINTGCVKTINVYATRGKQTEKVFHFKRIGNLAPWQMKYKGRCRGMKP
ncbi:hypothetical protein LCGC14_0363140 [marine sediment metagenome]|uniref:Uncharacterized protein n=1 Tax=marine sediment metagenome TaxID=412755 RepID=A0A0F9WFM7_9ZZZZ